MPYKKRREKIYVCEECGFSTGDVRLVPKPISYPNPNPTKKYSKIPNLSHERLDRIWTVSVGEDYMMLATVLAILVTKID